MSRSLSRSLQRLSAAARLFAAVVLFVVAPAGWVRAESAPAGPYVRTDSGLQYKDVVAGSGPAARSGSRVAVRYTGWLRGRLNTLGKQFDATGDSDPPFRFVLGSGQVIQGWDEGVAGMRAGGVRWLVVPAALGYGARGAGDAIPPNAGLIFRIEMIKIN